MGDRRVDGNSANFSEEGFEDSTQNSHPLSLSLVQEIAEVHGVAETRLANVLSRVGDQGSPISLSSLLEWGEVDLVGIFSNDTVGLSFETDTRWQSELHRLNVGSELGTAVIESHKLQVRSLVDDKFHDEFVILVNIPSGGFSEDVCRRILKLHEETTLDVRESIVYALYDDLPSVRAITERLNLDPQVVQSALDNSIAKLDTARKTVSMVDTPSSMSILELNYTTEDWLGLQWTQWFELEDTHELNELPTTAGLYRVRHTATDEIVYIGESGGKDGIRGRCRSLSSGVYDEKMPSKGSHSTRQRLWSLYQRDGGLFELSVATPPVASHDRMRRGMEAAAIAMYRRATGHSPRVQFGRSVSLDDSGSATSLSEDPFTYVSDVRSISPPQWTNWRNVTSHDWLGLDWSLPTPLGERTTIDVDGECVYRIWSKDDGNRLVFVGEAETPTSRLFRTEREYGSETLFSLTSVSTESFADGERLRRRLERKIDLQGAHFLATGSPPELQFGNS